MPGYGDFAFWYDQLNSAADYDAVAERLVQILKAQGVGGGLLADLGCGTGELCLRLARAGYEMIGIDTSPEMLSVFRQKIEGEDILLLCQSLDELDLFGTVRAAVSSFDTFNHLQKAQIEEMLRRLNLFIEPKGLLVFDVNTPYKHKTILAGAQFEIEAADINNLYCVWCNRLDEGRHCTDMDVTVYQDGKAVAHQQFSEYYYELSFWEESLQRHGFSVCEVTDGENFGPLCNTSERALIVAKRG